MRLIRPLNLQPSAMMKKFLASDASNGYSIELEATDACIVVSDEFSDAETQVAYETWKRNNAP